MNAKTFIHWLSFGLIASAAAADEDVPSFKNDVLTVFMSAGCNAGDCHGSARGKDGFMLSLFGYDPAGDFYRLMEEHIGRRINLASPEDSLLLTKATGKVAHSGGELFSADSEAYDIIRTWIEAGAPRDAEDAPDVTGIRMEPPVIEFASPVGSAETKVIATYSDGAERDVTRWALYMSSNEGVVNIDEAGHVSPARAGGAHVFARFNRFTQGSEVFILPGSDEFEWNAAEPANYIDELVYEKLRKLRIHPSEICSDGDFLRRVTIDITGMLPTEDEYHAFMDSEDPDKRAKVVDELISREDFGEMWVAKWGEWLRIKTDTNVGAGTAPKVGAGYFYWLRDQFIADRPMNELFHELVTASGSSLQNPASNFFNMIVQGNEPPNVIGQNVAQVTLGIQTQCAECHNHPFDRWTMDDYYAWTSFFTGLKRKHGRIIAETYFATDPNAPLAEHLVDGRSMEHQFLGGGAPNLGNQSPRQALAAWMTSTDNELFRENIANRTWDHFFGRGIVDPIDDVRISNPPSNQQLLKELGRRLAEEHGYRLSGLVRDICLSNTYQTTASTLPSNQNDSEFFSHASLRRPRADVLFDCMNQAMGNTPRIRRSTRTKAIDLFDGGRGDNYNMYFYATFGQSRRASVNDSETSCDPSLSQALHLVNGNTINRPLARESKLIQDLMGELHETDPRALVDRLFIRSLSRTPDEEEWNVIKSTMPETKYNRDWKIWYDGVMWSLLNSSEFLYNH
ncbi:MAG: DUF1549 domain-containing protein [Verrucomicrobiota bacterium]